MLEGVTSTPISDSIGDGPLSAKNVTEAQLVALRDTKSTSNSAERFFGCTNAESFARTFYLQVSVVFICMNVTKLIPYFFFLLI
jgi:hypothetical protein